MIKNAQTIYYNGHIYRGVDSAEKPLWKDSVVTSAGRIVFVGSSNEALSYKTEKTKMIDLEGKYMFPGFIDAHAHPIMAAYYLSGFVLDVGMDREAILRTLEEYVKENPDKDTYFGHGYAEWIFEGAPPTKEELDEICSERPVLITGSSGHEGWCNSKALELAGIDRNFPDPIPGFQFFRRDEKGNPTGHFMETACLTVLCNRLNIFEEETVRKQLDKVLSYFSSIGITSIAECGAFSFMEDKGMSMLRDLAEKKSLKQRIFGCCFVAEPGSEKDAIRHLKALNKENNYKDWFEINTLKIINDGTIESRTASLMEPYTGENECVMPMIEGEQLQSLCLEAAENGFDIYIHAIGDRAAHETVMAAEKIRNAGYMATRITNAHTELVIDDDIDKFAQYDITANTTGGWHYGTLDEKAVLGDRSERQFPLQPILKCGGRMSLGSDFPVDEQGADPMISVEIGMSRRLAGKPDARLLPPEDYKLRLSQMIDGYTISAAYQLGMEEKLGTIEPGMYADFTVLNEDPFTTDMYDIHKIGVFMTVVEDKITYSAKEPV